jgi:hypothetical protein
MPDRRVADIRQQHESNNVGVATKVKVSLNDGSVIRRPPAPPPTKDRRRTVNVVYPHVPDMTPAQPSCSVCAKSVYLAERLTIEGRLMHKRCFRCAYCNNPLRLGNCTIDRSLHTDEKPSPVHFYCPVHALVSPDEKLARLQQNITGASTSTRKPCHVNLRARRAESQGIGAAKRASLQDTFVGRRKSVEDMRR